MTSPVFIPAPGLRTRLAYAAAALGLVRHGTTNGRAEWFAMPGHEWCIAWLEGESHRMMRAGRVAMAGFGNGTRRYQDRMIADVLKGESK